MTLIFSKLSTIIALLKGEISVFVSLKTLNIALCNYSGIFCMTFSLIHTLFSSNLDYFCTFCINSLHISWVSFFSKYIILHCSNDIWLISLHYSIYFLRILCFLSFYNLTISPYSHLTSLSFLLITYLLILLSILSQLIHIISIAALFEIIFFFKRLWM